MKRTKIKGEWWKINNLRGLRSPKLGLCNYERKVITIPVNGDTREELDTIIHEVIHARFDFLEEPEVKGLANDLSRLLWTLKWRKKQDE